MGDDIEQREEKWRPRTRLVRGGTRRSGFGETSEAVFLNSGFRYDTAETAEARFKGREAGFVYSRYGNPTVAMFQRRMALMEGAEACFATASGMAAVFAALMSLVRAGDHGVSSRALFGSCDYIVSNLLPRYGIETSIIDGRDLDQWRAAIRPETRFVFMETPSNPTLEIIDLPAVAEMAHAAGAQVVVDNVTSTPILQRPLDLGADIVVYSATKHIDGQGRVLGGAVLGTEEFIAGDFRQFVRHTGPSMSPFNAWVLLKGLETLDLRVARHCDNSAAIAALLEQHPAVEAVAWPGLASHPQYDLARRLMSGGGSIIALTVKDAKAGAFRFLNALRLIDISNNLGDAKTLVTHPATTTHQRLAPEDRARLGIGEGMLRLSVGLEDVEDIKDDLTQALDKV